MSLKILFIIPLVSSYSSFLKELGTELINSDWEIFLLTNNSQKMLIPRISILHCDFPRGMNLLKHFRCIGKIRKVVSTISPDVIHSHFSANIFTVALSKEKKWPYVIGTFHGLSFPLVNTRWKRLLLMKAEIYAARKMDKICVLTEDDAILLKRHVDGGKVHRYLSSGIGCDIVKFDPLRYSDVWIKEKKNLLGIDSSDFVLIFIGRFVDFKGFALVARAFMCLVDTRPQYKLLLLGCKDEVHPTGLSLEEERSFLNHNNVINIGYTNQVEDYLAITNLTVFPSCREGMPVNVMESLAMGVPAIVSNSRGSNMLVSSVNGYVLKNLCVEELVHAILELSQNPLLLKHLSQNALSNRILYDRLCYIREQMEIYDKIQTSL